MKYRVFNYWNIAQHPPARGAPFMAWRTTFVHLVDSASSGTVYALLFFKNDVSISNLSCYDHDPHKSNIIFFCSTRNKQQRNPKSNDTLLIKQQIINYFIIFTAFLLFFIIITETFQKLWRRMCFQNRKRYYRPWVRHLDKNLQSSGHEEWSGRWK